MNVKRNSTGVVLFALAALSLGWIASASATVITTGCAHVNSYCTYQELENPFASINIDNVVFNNFGDILGSPSEVKVTPIDSVGSGVGSIVGLQFTPLNPSTNPWLSDGVASGTGSASIAAEYTYDVSVLTGLPIGAATLNSNFILNVSSGYYSYLYAQKTIDRSPYPTQTATTNCASAPLGDCNGLLISDQAVFAANDIALKISDDLFGSATQVTGMGSLQIGFSQFANAYTRVPVRVPDPSTLALIGVGLLALCVRLHRYLPVRRRNNTQ